MMRKSIAARGIVLLSMVSVLLLLSLLLDSIINQKSEPTVEPISTPNLVQGGMSIVQPAEILTLTPTASPVPTSTPQTTFRTALRELSFGQISDRLGYVFRTLQYNELPNQPYAIVRHLDIEFNIGVTLDAVGGKQWEELLQDIRVEGKAKLVIEGRDAYRVLRLSEMGDSFKVILGDIPPIVVTKLPPLTITLQRERTSDNLTAMFAYPPSDQLTRATAFVPSQERAIVIRFSEEMDTSWTRGLPPGKWLDNRRFSWDIGGEILPHGPERVGTGTSVEGFRSTRGNYVGAYGWEVQVQRVQAGEWKSLLTDERVGWSEWDTYYETMTFSPDGSRYIGAAMVATPEGDGSGLYETLVLEQKGKPPVTIESSIYLNVFHAGAPIQWIDDNRILYADYRNVYVYSLTDGKRRVVYDSMNTGSSVMYAAYDRYSKELNVLTQTYEVTKEGEERLPVDLYVYEDVDRLKKMEKRWSEAYFTQSYVRPLVVFPVQNGVFRTVVKERKTWTLYEARDGSVKELPGEVRYADNQLALLLEETPTAQGLEQKLWVWQKGSEPVLAPSPGGETWIRFAGNRAIVEMESTYLIYDMASNSWIEWGQGSGILAVSPQTAMGMYKTAVQPNR